MRKTCFFLLLVIGATMGKPLEDETSEAGEVKTELAEQTGRSVSSSYGVFGRAFRSAENLFTKYIGRLMHVFGGLEGLLATGLRRMSQPDMRPVAHLLDRIVVLYMRAVMEEEECQERFTCEAGDMIGEYFGAPVKRIVKIIDPMTPEYLKSILTSFRMGVKDGEVCKRMVCDTESYSFLKINDQPETELDNQIKRAQNGQ